VLGDAHPQPRGEQGRRGRNVECPDCPPTGAAGVHQIIRTSGRQSHHGAPHGVGRSRHLVRGLSLHAETDEQRRDLRRRRFALHDRSERGA